MSGALQIATALQAEAPLLPDGIFYDAMRKEYLWPLPSGAWLPLAETQIKRHLKALGLRADRDRNENVSPVDAGLNFLQLHRSVDYAGPLAGYRAGLHDVAGRNVLVTSSPVLIEPAPIDCPAWHHLVLSLLREQDQVDVFLGWLRVFLESLRAGKPRGGQALVLAGPRDGGKSLLQNLLTDIFGGRCAKPYQHAIGGTPFNSDLFGAEHLAMEDEAPSTDMRARRTLGAFIKTVAANEVHRLHAKHRDALALSPNWRLTISVNDEPEHLQILPPLDESLLDKILLLKCCPPDEPFNDGTPEGRAAFLNGLKREMPGFIHHVLSTPISERWQHRRFGVRAYQHPDVVRAISELSDEVRLLSLVDTALPLPWEGTADELERALRSSTVSDEAGRLLRWAKAAGTYLGRLSADPAYSERVSKAGHRFGVMTYRITAP